MIAKSMAVPLLDTIPYDTRNTVKESIYRLTNQSLSTGSILLSSG
nr:10655_t:CDS:2 [Entrophospora candida]